MFLRRGQYGNIELWFLMAALLLAAIAGLDILRDTKDRLDGTLLEKNFVARDLVMTLEAIYASPGDIEYTYGLGHYKFYIDILDSGVSVREAFIETNPISYRLVRNEKVDLQNVRMTLNVIDKNLPVSLIISKKFDRENAKITIDANNAELCVVDVNCPGTRND